MASSLDARVLVVRRGRPLVAGDPFEVRLLPSSAVPDDSVLVPLDDEPDATRLLALETDATDDAAFATLGLGADEARFADVMTQLGRFDGAARTRLLRAIALAQWSDASRFCGRCGFALGWEAGTRTKVCANPDRPHREFPRTDPATIVLVTHHERALLGRQKSWPPGMYSTLAGFVEPGETAEDGVAREVFEETGVRVDDVAYFGSESWPFPRSLMLGFTARATTTEIRLTDELDDARWFSRDEVRAMQTMLRTRMPHFETIARRLLATFARPA